MSLAKKRLPGWIIVHGWGAFGCERKCLMRSEIRLIASDIDGTLLRDGALEIAPEIFEHIRRLARKGILFCPASGRQYQSLRKLFTPVADRLPFLCENGAVVYGPGSPGPVWSKTVMDRPLAEALSRDIMALPGAEVLISGANTSYLCPKGADFEAHIRWFTGNNICRVPAPEEVPEEMVKVSAYCPTGTAEMEAALAPRWGGTFHAAVAGEVWLDFTLADKGTGLEKLCAALGVELDEVMAFGDNFNDISMLERAGRPYLMENAVPALKARFPVRCERVADVLGTL